MVSALMVLTVTRATAWKDSPEITARLVSIDSMVIAIHIRMELCGNSY